MSSPTRRASPGDAGRGENPIGRQVLRALSHPTRVAILAHLRSHETATPSELARELGLQLGALSYHVRRLEQLDVIDLVECRQRRGAVEHHYAITPAVADNELVRQVTAGLHLGRGEPSRANTRALLDATAVGELRSDLRHLFTRMRTLETETVRRAGVKGRAPTFAVEVSCVMDGEQDAGG